MTELTADYLDFLLEREERERGEVPGGLKGVPIGAGGVDRIINNAVQSRRIEKLKR